MSRLVDLPSEEQVRRVMQEIIEQAREIGGRPSVLEVARRCGLSNTTFRRNFPDIARELSALRRAPALDVASSPDAQRYTTLQDRNAQLRRDNKILAEHLELAVANIMRLTLENRQLRQEVEAAANVTNIGVPVEKLSPAASGGYSRRPSGRGSADR